VNTGGAIRKLGLGTAQFGLACGVTNARGQVEEPEGKQLRAVAAVAERAGVSRLSLCLRFAVAQPLVDRVIVGVELQQIVDAAKVPAALPDDVAKPASHDPNLLDPSLWSAEGQGG
jgi:hypothetical protein